MTKCQHTEREVSKNEILTQLYTSKDFNACIRKVCPEHLQDDLRQWVMEILCRKPDNEIITIHSKGQLKFYVVRIILNQVSRNGQFTKSHSLIASREPVHTQAECFDIERQHHAQRQRKEAFEDQLVSEVDELYWYDQKLFKLYLDKGSYRKVTEATGIPPKSVWETVNKVKQQIRSL